MFAGTRKRLAAAGDRTKAFEVRLFALLESFCFFLSTAVLLFLGVDVLLAKLGGFELTGRWLSCFQVLLAASVGFLTNWLAIEMLFKPYKPIKWLFFWRQGLIPRNKSLIGKRAGETISLELLKPDEIAQRLNLVLSEMFDSEEVRKEIAGQVLRFVRELIKDILNTQIEKIQGGEVQDGAHFFSKIIGGSRNRLGDFLKSRVSGGIDGNLNTERLSEWLTKELIPRLKPMAEQAVLENTPKVLENIDLGKLIAGQIEKQDVREFHQMVNDIAAEHLGAIQVLGFFLGGLIGLLQMLI